MILIAYKSNTNELVDNLLTVDETWVHHEPNQNKKSADSSIREGNRPLEAGQVKNSSKKTMATVWWCATGIVHIEY